MCSGVRRSGGCIRRSGTSSAGIWSRGRRRRQALAREVEEETGWKVRDIVWAVADWEWEYEGRVRRELDYLITVDGDLTRPRLEAGKHDASAWVGPDDLDLLMVNRTDGDRRLRDLVAHTVRTRFTDRLRLEPITGPNGVLPGHVEDLVSLYADPWVAHWYDESWSPEDAARRAAGFRDRLGAGRRQQVDRVRARWRSAGRPRRTVPDTGRHADCTWPSPSWWVRSGRSTGWSWDGRWSRRHAVAGWRPRSGGPGWSSRSGRWRPRQ